MLVSLKIPENATCLLKVGQKIEPFTPFYETKKTADFSIMIAAKLDVPPTKIFRYLKKFVGEKVEKGTTIAVKSSLLSSTKVMSDREGIIKEVNHHDGILVLSAQDQEDEVIPTYLKGEVAEIKNNEVKIKITAGDEYPLKNATASFGGKFLFVPNQDEHLLTTETVNGKVLVGEKLNSFLATKGEALGAIGTVSLVKNDDVLSIPQATLKNIEDLTKITKKDRSYCFIDPSYSKIIFYD